jgi:transcriptional regulator with XRE-family HTH domain
MAAKQNTLAENVAQNLLAIRTKRGESQAAFAAVLGISTSYVSMLERGGREMPLSTVETLSKKLKIPALTLLLPNPKI